MKKDNAALFILFSMLTYVPLAEAQLPDCEKITTSAIAGQGRYAVYCDGKQIKDETGRVSFVETDANEIILNKKLEAENYQNFKVIKEAQDQNEQARLEGKPLPYPGLDKPDPKDDAPFSD